MMIRSKKAKGPVEVSTEKRSPNLKTPVNMSCERNASVQFSWLKSIEVPEKILFVYVRLKG
jgi:hypothetical protein